MIQSHVNYSIWFPVHRYHLAKPRQIKILTRLRVFDLYYFPADWFGLFMACLQAAMRTWLCAGLQNLLLSVSSVVPQTSVFRTCRRPETSTIQID